MLIRACLTDEQPTGWGRTGVDELRMVVDPCVRGWTGLDGAGQGWTVLDCTGLHWTALDCPGLPCSGLPCPALHVSYIPSRPWLSSTFIKPRQACSSLD